MKISHNPDSHKGQNGKVSVLAGSYSYPGAAILATSAVLRSGVDLAYSIVPECNRDIIAITNPEFIPQTYPGKSLESDVLDTILKYSDLSDVLVLGPGLGRDIKILNAISKILFDIKIPVILDADGLYAIDESTILPKDSIITPHKTELFEIAHSLQIKQASPEKTATQVSKRLDCTVLLKGPIDYIIKSDIIQKNTHGNESLTKGGTGDILAGLCGGYLAQTKDPIKSAKLATEILGKAGESLFKKHGYSYYTSELLEEIKYVEI